MQSEWNPKLLLMTIRNAKKVYFKIKLTFQIECISIWKWFFHMHRYQDDIVAAHCPYLADALLLDSVIQFDGLPGGFNGIYPGEFLNIKEGQSLWNHAPPESPAGMVHHQDVAIVKENVHGPHGER